jgi:hypothetical protein
LKISKPSLRGVAKMLTAAMYAPVYTIYLLPARFLPFYEYFGNWRKLGFNQNYLNVFDKLNAPQTYFLRRKTIEKWFNPQEFSNVSISPYKGVSWRACGIKL